MVVSLYGLLELLTAVTCLHYLYDKKVKFNFKTVCFITSQVIWQKLIQLFQWNENLLGLTYLCMIIYCILQFGFDYKKIVINNILCIVIIISIQATIIMMMYMLFDINNITEKHSLLVNIGLFCVVLLGGKKFRLEKISKILQGYDKIIFSSMLIIAISVIFFITNYKIEKGFNIARYGVIFVTLVLIGVVIIDIGKHKMKALEMEAELRLHKLYEDSFKNLIDDICARQHEFDNHINTIYSQHFLCKTYEELVDAQKKYCKDIVSLNHYNKLLSTGNTTVLGFLYGKFSEAEKQGIELEYKVKIGDMESDVPIHKFIELLGNLINNAVEALTKETDINKMKVVLVERQYDIVVEVSNQCLNLDYTKIQDYFKKGYSEKGKNRGYGLWNVKKICEDYNIILEVATKEEDNVDWLRFVLIINKPLD